MAPACCIFSVDSKPKPPPSNPEKASTNELETILQYPEVTVKFSHVIYGELYYRFIYEKRSENISSAISSDGFLVSIKFFDVTWRVENNEFTFNNQQDTEGWKELMPFCEISESPEKLKAFDEIKPERFRELLNISEEHWVNAWNSSSYTKAAAPRASATKSDAQKMRTKEDERNKKAAEKKAIKEEKKREKRERKLAKEMKKREKKEKKNN